MKIVGLSSGRCTLLIPAPSDADVHGCFRSVARRFSDQVTGEGLWIEGDVPLSASLTATIPTAALARLLAAQSSIISRVELRFGGLVVSYLRSGGFGPTIYRQSFFDELRVECDGAATIQAAELSDVLHELCECLKATRARATPELIAILSQTELGIPVDVA